MFWHQGYNLFEITDETPQTFISLLKEIRLPGSARVLSKEKKTFTGLSLASLIPIE